MPLTETERNSSLGHSLRDAVFSNMYFSLTSVFVAAYALALGADSFFIGLLASVPLVFWTLAQIPASRMVAGGKNRRKVTVISVIISRTMWLPIILIPFTGTPHPLPLLLALVTVSSTFAAVAGPAWASWMGDIVPSKMRGKHFSSRLRLATIFASASLLLSMAVFSAFPRTSLTGFHILFSLGIIAGIVSAYHITRMREPEPEAADEKKSKSILKVLRDRRMKIFMAVFFVWQFGVMMSKPFYVVRLIEYMNADYFWISAQAIISSMSMFLFQAVWGRYSDRFGNKVVLTMCSLGAAFHPLFWVFAQYPVHIIPIEIIGGIAWGGFNLAYFNYLLEISPSSKRSQYSAFFYLIVGIAGIIAPIAGGSVANIFETTHMFGFTGIEAVFIISWIIRLSGVVLFIKFLEEIEIHRHVRMTYVFGEMVKYGQRRAVTSITMTGRKGGRAVILTSRGVRKAIRETNGTIRKLSREAMSLSSSGIKSGRGLYASSQSMSRHLRKTISVVPARMKILEKSGHDKEARMLKRRLIRLRKDVTETEQRVAEILQSPQDVKESQIRILTRKVRRIREQLEKTRSRLRKLPGLKNKNEKHQKENQ